MPTKERLIEFLAYLEIGQTRFEEKVGLSNGLINNIKGSISTKTLSKIADFYPELNTDWLLTGKGSMLKEDEKFSNQDLIKPPFEKQDTLFMGSNELENGLLRMIQRGEIYPAIYVKTLQSERDELLKRNAILEEKLKEFGKRDSDVHPGDNVKCAGAG